MSIVSERQAELATIRRQPIKPALKAILLAAAEAAGIDEVVVTSGGQGRAGSGQPRTGSTRHDDGNAADLELHDAGKVLNFEVPLDRVKVAAFVTACAARGATGIGGSVDYMGPHRLHVGFGSKAIWGGKHMTAAGAPRWLREACEAGWANPVAMSLPRPTLKLNASGDAVKALQEALNRAGIVPRLNVDGDFGKVTDKAVRAFQTARGLTVDGEVGPKTWAALS